MVLRWGVAGMVKAQKQFRRVSGHLRLNALRSTLDQHVASIKTPSSCTAKTQVAA